MEKIGMDSESELFNYSLNFYSRENKIIPIGIHSDMFHDRYPDLGIVCTNFIRIDRNRKIPMTLYNKSIFRFLIVILVLSNFNLKFVDIKTPEKLMVTSQIGNGTNIYVMTFIYVKRSSSFCIFMYWRCIALDI